MLGWVEAHPGLAGWAQAIGAIVAIAAAFLISYLQIRADRKDRAGEHNVKAQSLSLLLLAEVQQFVSVLREIRRDKDFVAASRVDCPATLLSRIEELHLLGAYGGALLQMISILNANRSMAQRSLEAIADHGIDEADLWPPIDKHLSLAIADADDAIAGMTEIVHDAAERSRARMAT